MASLCSRLILRNSRAFSFSAAQCNKNKFPEPLELATGLEKKVLLAELAGNDDPFMMSAIKKRETTKDDPILIPSAFDSRIIGCICEEEQTYVCWMWVHAGSPRRCECGYWFKLVHKEPITAQ